MVIEYQVLWQQHVPMGMRKKRDPRLSHSASVHLSQRRQPLAGTASGVCLGERLGSGPDLGTCRHCVGEATLEPEPPPGERQPLLCSRQQQGQCLPRLPPAPGSAVQCKERRPPRQTWSALPASTVPTSTAPCVCCLPPGRPAWGQPAPA